MTVSLDILIELIKIVSSVAIFFVWVVRYENIRKEFDEYNLPTWLRDLTGILKLSFACMLHSSNPEMVVAGCTIDYVTELGGAYLKVINPNATASCGCGESFSV